MQVETWAQLVIWVFWTLLGAAIGLGATLTMDAPWSGPLVFGGFAAFMGSLPLILALMGEWYGRDKPPKSAVTPRAVVGAASKEMLRIMGLSVLLLVAAMVFGLVVGPPDYPSKRY